MEMGTHEEPKDEQISSNCIRITAIYSSKTKATIIDIMLI